jgi:hypothetical protein
MDGIAWIMGVREKGGSSDGKAAQLGEGAVIP